MYKKANPKKANYKKTYSREKALLLKIANMCIYIIRSPVKSYSIVEKNIVWFILWNIYLEFYNLICLAGNQILGFKN